MRDEGNVDLIFSPFTNAANGVYIHRNAVTTSNFHSHFPHIYTYTHTN